MQMRRARSNRDRVPAFAAAVDEIEKMGGTVTIEYERRRRPTLLEEVFGDRGNADDPLDEVSATYAQLARDIDDRTVDHLTRLPNLRTIEFSPESEITDASLGRLSRLPDVSVLLLGEKNITDDGLRHLKGLTNALEILTIQRTKVTDAGLEHLRGFKSLTPPARPWLWVP